MKRRRFFADYAPPIFRHFCFSDASPLLLPFAAAMLMLPLSCYADAELRWLPRRCCISP